MLFLISEQSANLFLCLGFRYQICGFDANYFAVLIHDPHNFVLKWISMCKLPSTTLQNYILLRQNENLAQIETGSDMQFQIKMCEMSADV